MTRLPVMGVDEDGFILTLPETSLQPEFEVLLADVCTTLALVQPTLDGVYLYGSIARGEARPGVCDLDLTLVFRDPPSGLETQTLETVRQQLQARHKTVSKIDFDVGSRSQVLAPENLYSWGYWLKHHCRNLWGNDLARHFGRFWPSREIAVAVNGDFQLKLAAYATLIEQAETPTQQLRLKREASRKLIRSTQVLRPEHALAWPWTLEEHIELFLVQFPAKGSQMVFFLAHANGHEIQGKEFVTHLRSFSNWMAEQLAKQSSE
ncbi:nucleotidyltransferase domain-containing protein [Pseudomonas sp. 15FMM2]|uniref:Nucleotidyltransferase domain-containing protein n=1 Tax=Pseudomonas imrae TaxID=2992837 RepID=A0ACC7PC04_9PSED